MSAPRLDDLTSLHLVLTAGCNLRCTYCYQNAKQDRAMDEQTLQRAVDLALASRRDEVEVVFYGGEPLLRLDLCRQVVARVAARGLSRPRVRYATITNGTLLRDEAADFLAEHGVGTRISLDGVPAAQNLRGRGTHRVVDANVDRLRARHPRFFRERVNVNMTLSSATVPLLADSFDYLLSKDFREIHLYPLDTHDPGWGPGTMEALDRQFARIFRASVRHFRWSGRVPLVLFRKGRRRNVHAPRGRSMCGVGRGETLTVDADGEVYGCGTFARSFQSYTTPFLASRLEPLRLGPLAAQTLPGRLALFPAAVRAAEIFDRKQEKYSSYASCGSCRFLSTCTVCPVSIGNIPGNADPRRVPDNLCAFNLVAGAWRERFPSQPEISDTLLGRAALPGVMRKLRRHVEALRSGGGP